MSASRGGPQGAYNRDDDDDIFADDGGDAPLQGEATALRVIEERASDVQQELRRLEALRARLQRDATVIDGKIQELEEATMTSSSSAVAVGHTGSDTVSPPADQV